MANDSVATVVPVSGHAPPGRAVRRLSLWLVPCALAFAIPLTAQPRVRQAAPLEPLPAGEGIRGITISTHGSGRDWGDDRIVPTMEAIRGAGAEWVATHPYARIHADGRVTFREFPRDRPPEYLVRPIREAHALGLKILIKPHLAYWGSPFRWRGEIEFGEPEQWERFWKDYRRWIVALARACREADGFCVGTELDRTLRDDARWRGVVAAVREQTRAPLTYAANWTDYDKVGFWDALDVIGIQAYFPLTENPEPDAEQLRAAWASRMAELRRYAQENRRRIVFTELGYDRSFRAPTEPWKSGRDGPKAEPIQLACMRTALGAIEAEPAVLGAFLWKWFPAPNRRGDFRVDTPVMKSLLREVWRAGK